MQSDHTHLITCKEEGKGQCWAGRWWRGWGARCSSCFNSYLPPPSARISESFTGLYDPRTWQTEALRS